MVLAIETSTKNCSVALIEHSTVRAQKEAHSDQYIHSESLHLFMQEVLQQAAVAPADLKGIAVGSGPGSYTGLRIGVSAAKAMAYSLQIPLLSATGLELLIAAALHQFQFPQNAMLHPMIDARRMEVYTAAHKLSSKDELAIEAQIIDENSYQEPVEHFFFGDGASKFEGTLEAPNHHFLDLTYPSAAHFQYLIEDKINNEQFEDVAYFKPYYGKDFQAIKPKSVF